MAQSNESNQNLRGTVETGTGDVKNPSRKCGLTEIYYEFVPKSGSCGEEDEASLNDSLDWTELVSLKLDDMILNDSAGLVDITSKIDEEYFQIKSSLRGDTPQKKMLKGNMERTEGNGERIGEKVEKTDESTRNVSKTDRRKKSFFLNENFYSWLGGTILSALVWVAYQHYMFECPACVCECRPCMCPKCPVPTEKSCYLL